LRFVRQRLGDHDAAFHAAGEGHDFAVALVEQGKISQQAFDELGIRRSAEQAAAEGHRRPHRFKGIGAEFLRHQADHGARSAIVAHDIVAVRGHGAGACGDDAANDVDQRGFARTIGAEQRENLAALDVQIDRLQGLKAGRVGFGDVLDRDDGRHGS
jgi:hypothetical protein